MTSKPSWLTLFVGLVVCFYPNFVFWTPYILTETLHLFILAVFALSMIIFLKNINIVNFLIVIATGVVFGLSRPNAIPVFVFSVVFLVSYLFYQSHGIKLVVLLLIFCVTLSVICLTFILYRPQIRNRVLNIPTIYQSLWLSTRVTNNNIDHLEMMMAPPPEVTKRGYDFVRQYKIDYAVSFIMQHPFRYLSMAAERFISFWYPWLFARWSKLHIFLDAFLSISLTLLAVFALRNKDCPLSPKLFLLGSALTLALLTSFSQIDSDGRYRLPAELLLMPLMTLGIPTVLSYVGITGKGKSGDE
jgi:hypothetical protein